MKEQITKILEEAADAQINLHSEVARAMLVEKIMIEIGYFMMETNNG